MRPSNPPTVLWNPPAGLANESGGISSGLVGEIGVSPGRSMRPTGPCGTNIDSGAGASGCSGAGVRTRVVTPSLLVWGNGSAYDGAISP